MSSNTLHEQSAIPSTSKPNKKNTNQKNKSSKSKQEDNTPAQPLKTYIPSLDLHHCFPPISEDEDLERMLSNTLHEQSAIPSTSTFPLPTYSPPDNFSPSILPTYAPSIQKSSPDFRTFTEENLPTIANYPTDFIPT